MQALVVRPGTAHSARVAELPDPRPAAGEVLVRTLEVGVCGTDREIAEGLFGTPPHGADALVLGHEFLGIVERDGDGFTRGDLVTGMVRRACGRCAACAEGAPDACDTGDYLERGITRLHGFASELVAEGAGQLIPVPRALGRLGVLAEPTSICCRGLRHARAIGGRQPWAPRRALVLGAGAIGMLATCLLRLDGMATWTAARSARGEKAELVAATGASFVSTAATPLADLRDELGGFDLVIEAAGDAQLMLDSLGLLRRNGVACLLGLDGRTGRVALDGHVIGLDAVVENRVLFGSVNAHRTDWHAAVAALGAMRTRWPGLLEQFVGLRVPLDRYADAFAFRGVKATLQIAPADPAAA